MNSVTVFDTLEAADEARPNWRQVGSLRIATSESRVAEFECLKSGCDEAGLEVDFLEKSEAARLWPDINLTDAKSILWCPSDGYLQPNDLVMSYQYHSRRMGVKFATGTMVEEILHSEGCVTSVKTNSGVINCQTVINAAGSHAYHVAMLAGIQLPIIPIARYYLITERIDGILPTFPVVRFPDLACYARPDVNSVMTGGHGAIEPSLDPRSYLLSDQVPNFDDEMAAISDIGETLTEIYPPLSETGIRSIISGWPAFTPDGQFIIGECSRLKGFVMAAGCNARGVSGSPGFAQLVVKSMFDDEPSPYVQSLSPDRFNETGWTWQTAMEQAKGVCNAYYDIAK